MTYATKTRAQRGARRGLCLALLTPLGLAAWGGPHDSLAMWNLEVVGQIGGGQGRAVHVEGNYAYLCLGRNFVILDVSNSASPTQVGRVFVAEEALGLDVEGNLAFVAAGGRLHIIDVAHPATPRVRAVYVPPDGCWQPVDVRYSERDRPDVAEARRDLHDHSARWVDDSCADRRRRSFARRSDLLRLGRRRSVDSSLYGPAVAHDRGAPNVDAVRLMLVARGTLRERQEVVARIQNTKCRSGIKRGRSTASPARRRSVRPVREGCSGLSGGGSRRASGRTVGRRDGTVNGRKNRADRMATDRRKTHI